MSLPQRHVGLAWLVSLGKRPVFTLHTLACLWLNPLLTQILIGTEFFSQKCEGCEIFPGGL